MIFTRVDNYNFLGYPAQAAWRAADAGGGCAARSAANPARERPDVRRDAPTFKSEVGRAKSEGRI